MNYPEIWNETEKNYLTSNGWQRDRMTAWIKTCGGFRWLLVKIHDGYLRLECTFIYEDLLSDDDADIDVGEYENISAYDYYDDIVKTEEKVDELSSKVFTTVRKISDAIMRDYSNYAKQKKD